MKKKDWILSSKEKRKEEKQQNVPDMDWYKKTGAFDAVVFVVMLLILPTIIIVSLIYKYDVELNVPLAYLVMDLIMLIPISLEKITWPKYAEEILFFNEERLQQLKHLLEELEESEKAQGEAAREKEADSKKPKNHQ